MGEVKRGQTDRQTPTKDTDGGHRQSWTWDKDEKQTDSKLGGRETDGQGGEGRTAVEGALKE